MNSATKRRGAVLLVIAIALIGASCGSSSKPKASAKSTTTIKGAPAAAALTLYTTTDMKPVVQKLADAYEAKNKGSNVTVEAYPAASLADKTKTGKPDGVIATGPGMKALQKSVKLKGDPTAVGENMFVILVPKGNPKHIDKLSVFGADAATKSGLCAKTSPCGTGPARVLAAAKITPAPDVTETTPAKLVDAITGGKIDATSLPRRAYTLAPDKLSAVGIPAKDSFPVPIQLGELKDDSEGVPAFATFLKAATAQRILQNAGFADAG